MSVNARTCKFFDAAESDDAPSVDGTPVTPMSSHDIYPYNRHLKFRSCWNPRRSLIEAGVADPEAAHQRCCVNEYMKEMIDCPYYEAEDPERMLFTRISPDDDAQDQTYHYVLMTRIRMLFGIQESLCVHWSADHDDAFFIPEDYEVVFSANAEEHPEDLVEVTKNAFKDAVESYEGKKQVLPPSVVAEDDKLSYTSFLLAQVEA